MNRQSPDLDLGIKLFLQFAAGGDDRHMMPHPGQFIGEPQNMSFHSAFVKFGQNMGDFQVFHLWMIHSAALLASLNERPSSLLP